MLDRPLTFTSQQLKTPRAAASPGSALRFGGPVFPHRVLWQRPAVPGHDVCLGSARSEVPGRLCRRIEQADRQWCVYVCPHSDVPHHQRLCHQDGRRVHDLVRHHLGPDTGYATLAGVAHLRTGARVAGQHQLELVDDADLSWACVRGQLVHPDFKPAQPIREPTGRPAVTHQVWMITGET